MDVAADRETLVGDSKSTEHRHGVAGWWRPPWQGPCWALEGHRES
jgi:hypothetical protein